VKKFLLRTLLVLGLLYAFRGPLFRCLVAYRPVAERPSNTREPDAQIKKKLDKWLKINQNADLQAKADFAQAFAAQQLTFTWGKAANEPNQAFREGRANCIGYAALSRLCLTYLVENTGKAQVTCTHQIGSIRFLGYNVHRWFSHPMFRDHDFVQVKDRSTGEIISFDPSLYDYFGISAIKTTDR
jgi:hypothetical protein